MYRYPNLREDPEKFVGLSESVDLMKAPGEWELPALLPPLYKSLAWVWPKKLPATHQTDLFYYNLPVNHTRM